MSADEATAVAYLSPSTDALWRWSADGEALVWSDGSTIAFRPEVEAVLRRLAPRGLPPLGAVAVLLAACRDGWEASAGRASFLRYADVFGQWRSGAAPGAAPHASQLVFERVAAGVRRVTEGLDAVAALPPGLRRGTEAKAVLAETVFDAAPPRLSPREAESVVRALADGVAADRLTLRVSSTEALREFADDADALRPGLPGVNAESLALRRRTGLDEAPAPAELDLLSPPQHVRRLLAELRRDAEFAGLARLAQDLMAAVHVPRALHAREELPLGGVSDLSNRGPLDRLLVSELANDELTLSVRVALNEALYLRRESPPRQPPQRRAILLDAGVRMWGVPRVFATAVALALAATAEKGADVAVFRAAPGGAEPVDLTTRAGLVAWLEVLEADPHPGAALRPFLAEPGPKAAGSTDAILVTHPDALADPDFAASLRDSGAPALFAATVDRDGSFRLSTVTPAGRTTIREARLSLDALFAPAPEAATPDKSAARAKFPGSPLLAGTPSHSLPAIFFAEPFPLRLPHTADPKHARVSTGFGLVAVAKDGRLLHWDNPHQAARQLTALLPPGKRRGIWVDDETGVVRVAFSHARQAPLRLVTASLTEPRVTQADVPLRNPNPHMTFARAGILFVVSKSLVEAFDLSTAAAAGISGLSPHLKWRHGRYFTDHKGAWIALSHNGQMPVFERVPYSLPSGRLLELFDREGFDGPWALLKDGRVLDGSGNEFPRRFPNRHDTWQLIDISPDGHRLAMRGPEKLLLDLESDEAPWPITSDPGEELAGPTMQWSTRFPWNVRHKFDGVFVDPGGHLCLATADKAIFRIGTNEAGEPILKELGRATDAPRVRRFEPVAPPQGMRIELKAADFRGAGRVFLDPRGMLHLKGADPLVPEVSLVLTTHKLAGWSSDGRLYGPTPFHGDGPVGEPFQFASIIRQIAESLGG